MIRIKRNNRDPLGPDEASPDYAQPIVGWRLWTVVEREGLLLRSLFHPSVWPRREAFAAVCERWTPVRRALGRRHETPNDHCLCGIYAGDLGVIGEYLDDPPGIGGEALPRVIGLVSLWGSVVECERGWRASRAYPATIIVPSFAGEHREPEELAAGLSEYGVPVEVVAATRPRELIELLGRDQLLRSRRSNQEVRSEDR